jgi:hypothetical protein
MSGYRPASEFSVSDDYVVGFQKIYVTARLHARLSRPSYLKDRIGDMRSTRRYSAAVMVCLGVAVLLLAYPNYVIRPYRYQDPGQLRAALFVLQYRFPVEVAAAVAACIAAVAYSGRRKAWVAIAAAVAMLCAVFSRVNIYELMFHPSRPAFGPAGKSKLDGDEKVIAISMGGAARAYPVRSISYHHIVNDVLGGVPIVATY